MLDGEESAVLFICAVGGDLGFGEIALEAVKTVERVGTDAVDAEGERELLAGARLIVREDGRGGFEEGIAAGGEARRVGALVEKGLFLRKPADVSGLEAALESLGRDIEERRAGATAEVFVTTSEYEISAHGSDVYGQGADGVIGVDQEARAALMTCIGEAIEIGEDLAGGEEDLRHDN